MSGQLLGFDPNVESSVPLFPLGRMHTDEKGRLWVYGQANGAQTAGEASQFTRDGNWDATPMTTTTQDSKLWNVGVPNIAMTDNYYGWFFHGCGEFEIVVANGVAALSPLTTTGTAGEVGTGGTLIDGLINIDEGVTSTRVTCLAFGRLTVAVIAAFD
jgi:hypothetical protein